jgi:hypothetical protein
MLLSSSSPPNGSWQVGETYESSNFAGGVMVSTYGGEEYQVNGTFTIEDAYNNDGERISGSGIESPDTDYQVSDVNETLRLLDTVKERLDRYDDLTTDNSGAGTAGEPPEEDDPDSAGILAGIGEWFGGLIESVTGSTAGIVGLVVAFVVVVLGLSIAVQVISP